MYWVRLNKINKSSPQLHNPYSKYSVSHQNSSCHARQHRESISSPGQGRLRLRVTQEELELPSVEVTAEGNLKKWPCPWLLSDPMPGPLCSTWVMSPQACLFCITAAQGNPGHPRCYFSSVFHTMPLVLRNTAKLKRNLEKRTRRQRHKGGWRSLSWVAVPPVNYRPYFCTGMFLLPNLITNASLTLFTQQQKQLPLGKQLGTAA